MPIKIELELTANQRSLLLSAALQYRRFIQEHHPSILSLDSEDIETLITLISRTSCGDPGCSYCGSGDLIHEYTDWEHQGGDPI